MTALEPDTKDWTWTLDRPCPECGLEASAVGPSALAAAVRACTAPWAEVLARPDAALRRRPDRWSDVEYGCHVRDVCRVFADRVRLVLDEDGPTFANWDQDVSARTGWYGRQDAAVVAAQVAADAEELARAVEAVGEDDWSREALRSNGSRFTTLTLVQYLLHDLAHHLWDVGVDLPAVRGA